MTNLLIFIWILAILLGGSAVAGLVWALVTGQLNNLQGTATSIFDEDEPVGTVTDHFPNASRRFPST